MKHARAGLNGIDWNFRKFLVLGGILDRRL